jgi:macrolide-specific efflux system membrane fusion protein
MNDIPPSPPTPAAPDALSRPPAAATARRPRRRKGRGRLVLALLGLLAAGAAGGAWWWQGSAAQGGPVPVTVEVTQGEVTDLVSAVGTLQPLRYVDVGAQVSGQVQKLHVKIGDRVTAGQLLAELDARTAQARVNTGEAELLRLRALLAQQEASRDLARLQAERQQTMFRANATSRDALETAQAQFRVLEAQIAQTRAQITGQESQLNADRTTLSYTRILAPMDGTVVSLAVFEGQTLNANMSAPVLMRIADLATMTVTAQVSEADQPRLTIGMPVRFNTLGMPGRRYEGQLRQIYPTPEVVNNVVLYSALFDVPNPDGALLPQMSAQVFFVRGQARDVPLVPVAALGPPARPGDPTRRSVQVQAEDGSVQAREVVIGVSDRVNAEVKEGLRPGDRVLLAAATQPAGPPRPRPRPPRL